MVPSPSAQKPELDSTDPTHTGANGTDPTPNLNGNSNGTAGEVQDEEDEEEVPAEAPTTRSKTAPHRKEPTPVPRKVDPIITLSDVHTAREVLAEKANAHWQKGLGGGQNKEGETIVNFLYKLKVGSGEFCFLLCQPSHIPYRNTPWLSFLRRRCLLQYIDHDNYDTDKQGVYSKSTILLLSIRRRSPPLPYNLPPLHLSFRSPNTEDTYLHPTLFIVTLYRLIVSSILQALIHQIHAHRLHGSRHRRNMKHKS